MLEVFANSGHVGGHFGKKSCTYYSFVSKVMCTKSGTERTTSHSSQVRPLEMSATLATILGKKVDEKLHLNTKVLCAKFG